MQVRNGQRDEAGGFTLVELLVVIGIIAVLIGILLPVLGGAQKRAREVVCQSNIRQLATGVGMYVQEFKGFMPVYLPHLAQNEANKVSSPQKTYRVGFTDTGVSTEVLPANHGVLYSRGLVAASEVFYCPEQVAPLWQVGAYPEPYLSEGSPGQEDGSETGSGVFLVRSSYMYNPYVPADINGVSNRTIGRFSRAYDKITDMPDKAVLFMDLMIGQSYAHQAHGDGETWAFAFIDGSALTHTSAEALRFNKLVIDLRWGDFAYPFSRFRDEIFVLPEDRSPGGL
ncbi:MAG: type II secretion system protein [Phycisphaerae bacterium]